MILHHIIMDLVDIHKSNVKMAEHWRKLAGKFRKNEFIKELKKRENQDRIQLEQKAAIRIQVWWRGICRRKVLLEHIQIICVQKFRNAPCSEENPKNVQNETNREGGPIEEEAITKIQAWWRGILYRQRKMLPEHKEKLRICVQEFRNVPCSEENPKNVQNETNREGGRIEEEAITKIQAWWRGILYRQRKMLPEHKEKLRICVQEFRNAPCSEENPKDERNEPLNLRIERYMSCLRSTVLTERKAMALRLNRLAERSHVAIECMLRRNIFRTILDCISELNRSEAHLYVIRPLSALTIKLLSQKPLVEPFALQHLDGLLSNAINLIHKNYKDAEVVKSQTIALKQLSIYPGFAEKMVALRFDWYIQKFKCLERFNQQRDDPRLLAYKRLRELNKLIIAAQTPNGV